MPRKKTTRKPRQTSFKLGYTTPYKATKAKPLRIPKTKIPHSPQK